MGFMEHKLYIGVKVFGQLQFFTIYTNLELQNFGEKLEKLSIVRVEN